VVRNAFGTSTRFVNVSLGSTLNVALPVGNYTVKANASGTRNGVVGTAVATSKLSLSTGNVRLALGLAVPAPEDASTEQTFSEKLVWDQLKTVYDPEIPISVADLGLIYSCVTTPLERGGKRLDIKMSMTAPGCGMGDVLKADVEGKLSRLPEVKEVYVEIVFDPPWGPERMSQAARLQLGFDI